MQICRSNWPGVHVTRGFSLGWRTASLVQQTPPVTVGYHGPLNDVTVVPSLREGTGTDKDFELEGGEGPPNHSVCSGELSLRRDHLSLGE